jgi:hypothetical protein
MTSLIWFIIGYLVGLPIGLLILSAISPKGLIFRRYQLLCCRMGFHKWPPRRIVTEIPGRREFQCSVCSLYSVEKRTVHPPIAP